MTAKITNIDIDYIINKHTSGTACKQLARELGVSLNTIIRMLNNAGIDTSRKVIGINMDHAIALFNDGIGISGIAKQLGYCRSVVTRAFKEAGINGRNRGEQQSARMANYTPEQKKELTKASNNASRGKPVKESAKINRAKSIEKSLKIRMSADETILADMLRARGIDTVAQKAIGIYNCDLATDTVAVEVFGGGWHWHGAHLARTEKRFNTIMNSGLNVLVVAVSDSSPLTDAVADYVAAYIKQSSMNPSASREYRVIWCAGKFTTCGGLNDNNFSIKPPFTNSRDIISGRYKAIAR